MSVQALHLHTYFFFPFSIDKEAVKLGHPQIWSRERRWLDGLDEWIAEHGGHPHRETAALGVWQRDAYTRFDFDSQAYQDMIFFHPFMRRVFFDIRTATPQEEALLRCYSVHRPDGSTLRYEASDVLGYRATIDVTDLRLFLFANGIGILSIGVEAFGLPVSHALWINESLRKIYPSSGQQVREGRMPLSLSLVSEHGGVRHVIAEHSFASAAMTGVLPTAGEHDHGSPLLHGLFT